VFLATPNYRVGGGDGGRGAGGRAPPPPPPGGREGGIGREGVFAMLCSFPIKKTAPRILTQMPSPHFWRSNQLHIAT